MGGRTDLNDILMCKAESDCRKRNSTFAESTSARQNNKSAAINRSKGRSNTQITGAIQKRPMTRA